MSAKAFRLSPSQHWDEEGNDGQWSTFAIQVGNPVKTLFVLPATSKRSTWVVNPLGCRTSDAQNCNTTRGGIFDPNLSTTWRNLSNTPGQQYRNLSFGTEQALNPLLPTQVSYSGAALAGTDRLAFGFPGNNDGPVLDNRLIASYAAAVPYVGVLGLSAYNETPSTFEDPHFSVLGALRNASAIPSLYWAYTAGAVYRDTFASLVLGGYDASRGNVYDVVSVPLPAPSDRQLVLTLRKTTLNISSRTQQVEMDPISVFIDSVVPEIWLPSAAYTAFESAFGLVWNDDVDLYLVNDTQHDLLTRENAAVTFSLAADSNNATMTDITLPYAAFNLTARYPLLGQTNTTASQRYFPLKRAQSDDQYYLGRTFLQEAYIAVDYDNNVFHVSPAKFDGGAEDIRTVTSSSPGPKGLSGGAIAGIVVGVLAGLAILGAFVWWFFFKNRRERSRRSSRKTKSHGTSSIGGTTIEAWQEDIPPGHVEHYKPAMSEVGSSDQDQFKQELDATATARGPTTFHRHELSAGTVRRTSDQSRASISPLEERNRRSHYRSGSYGVPSPRSADQMGAPSPPLPGSGQSSPPLSGSTSWFGGPVAELHGFSRGSPASPSTPAAVEEVPAVPGGSPIADRSTLNRLEGSNG